MHKISIKLRSTKVLQTMFIKVINRTIMILKQNTKRRIIIREVFKIKKLIFNPSIIDKQIKILI